MERTRLLTDRFATNLRCDSAWLYGRVAGAIGITSDWMYCRFD